MLNRILLVNLIIYSLYQSLSFCSEISDLNPTSCKIVIPEILKDYDHLKTTLNQLPYTVVSIRSNVGAAIGCIFQFKICSQPEVYQDFVITTSNIIRGSKFIEIYFYEKSLLSSSEPSGNFICVTVNPRFWITHPDQNVPIAAYRLKEFYKLGKPFLNVISELYFPTYNQFQSLNVSDPIVFFNQKHNSVNFTLDIKHAVVSNKLIHPSNNKQNFFVRIDELESSFGSPVFHLNEVELGGTHGTVSISQTIVFLGILNSASDTTDSIGFGSLGHIISYDALQVLNEELMQLWLFEHSEFNYVKSKIKSFLISKRVLAHKHYIEGDYSNAAIVCDEILKTKFAVDHDQRFAAAVHLLCKDYFIACTILHELIEQKKGNLEDLKFLLSSFNQVKEPTKSIELIPKIITSLIYAFKFLDCEHKNSDSVMHSTLTEEEVKNINIVGAWLKDFYSKNPDYSP